MELKCTKYFKLSVVMRNKNAQWLTALPCQSKEK